MILGTQRRILRRQMRSFDEDARGNNSTIPGKKT
jgi:hypothetical protein